jgi:hypothetical protein
MDTITENTRTVLIDSHVHIYSCFDLQVFLSSALRNFQGHTEDSQCAFCLLLTEARTDHYFHLLTQITQGERSANLMPVGWQIKTTEESCSLYASTNNHEGVFIIAGSQIITAENLEVLALLTTQRFVDGKPLETAIQEIVAGGGIPVVPWGFGKWMGFRGKVVAKFLEQTRLPLIFLGDNSGRPIFWSEPHFFKQARQRGLQILPGTDPLPFALEARRPGSFGFSIQGILDPKKPAHSIRQLLLKPTVQIQTYGSLERPSRFILNQLAMQILKLKRREI